MAQARRTTKTKIKTTETYQHPDSELLMRPEVGTQAQFKKKKGPQKYRYDSALAPELAWDGQNPARETGEALIKEIAECGLKLAELAKAEASAKRDREIEKLKARIVEAESRLRRISGAFLNWAGKAERLSFDVPTLPLFIHERLEEIGGIVPHITSSTIANYEVPEPEVLADRPEVKSGIVRVTGPFVFEGTIPTPVDWEGDGQEDSGAARQEDYGSFVDRMIEVLRRSPNLRLEGNRTVQLKQIRPPARSLSLSAEAMVANGTEKAVAIVFGPENGAVSEKLVYEAAREAHAKNYTHLYAIGFAIQPNARELIEKCAEVMGVAATYVQATPDLMMGDLLKNMRSSQIFSVCGLPEIRVSKVVNPKSKTDYNVKPEAQFQVELLGLDVFDPVKMEVDHQSGNDVPAWFLDTDYNGLCFHVSQAFFPRTGAWENLKKALKGDYEETVWDHLAGTTTAPFSGGEHGQVAVKVIDQRGNELLVVKSLKEAK